MPVAIVMIQRQTCHNAVTGVGAPLVGAPYSMKEEENAMLEAKIMYLLESTATKINYQLMRLGDEIVYRRNLRRVEKMEKKKGCETSD